VVTETFPKPRVASKSISSRSGTVNSGSLFRSCGESRPPVHPQSSPTGNQVKMPIGERIEGPRIDRFDGVHAPKHTSFAPDEINLRIPVVLPAIARVSLNK